ncbi:hypothetical protein HBH98_247030 [Parastagonospora nodorum]|nr:hypothetical protein HBH53_251000 [Parastagonospora nodorum]KAH3956002.1 hypothetical protein HBH51_258540 [Parastagonospora nodorum]KAH4215273.1 hypothetical protein HBI06_257880 [Parastagonospora nodorum]KAH4221313.1 hypothetical protein HBI05_256100 [Parastagonospora nodorum]KAH4333541.1 hypothetical protein HBH98_247030 [Parastagonospora nodorum]
MKRQLSTLDTASLRGSQERSFAPQKRCRTTENTPRSRPSPSQAPRTPESSQVDNDHQQQQTAGTTEAAQDHCKQYLCSARARYIREWAGGVSHSDRMSDSTTRRRHKVTVRTRVNKLRSHIIGDAYDNASELKGIPTKLKNQVQEIANDYWYHCGELTKDAKGEAEWKSALLEAVFRRLVKLLAQNMLATSASDKPWRTELKPRPPSLRDLLSSVTPQLSPAVDLSATPFASFEPTNQPYSTEPSEIATVISETTAVSTIEDHDPSNALTTPKPDILLGLARHSFTEVHQVLLGEWQDNGQLLSEPQLVQQGLHFPFLLVEAKGLATSGNMMGAENQAAVGGACAINILKALQRLEPGFPLAHIVFSISTEGSLHQLFIHYHIDGKYHMTVHRAWKVTLLRDCTEFVLALARIIQWGGGEYRNAVVASLARIVDSLQV